jgi:ATP-dependent DNA helicase RecQ
VLTHLCNAIECGEEVAAERIVTRAAQSEIALAFEKFGFSNLSGVREHLGNRYDFDELRICRAVLQAR